MAQTIKAQYWNIFNRLHDSKWGFAAAFVIFYICEYFLRSIAIEITLVVVFLALALPLPFLRWPLISSLVGVVYIIFAFSIKVPFEVKYFGVALFGLSFPVSFGCFVAKWGLPKVLMATAAIGITGYLIFSGILIKAVAEAVAFLFFVCCFILSRTVFVINLNKR